METDGESDIQKEKEMGRRHRDRQMGGERETGEMDK